MLADASRADAPAFVRGLDELWRRGIVRAHEHDLYDFSHGRIRDAAYEQLGPAQRREHAPAGGACAGARGRRTGRAGRAVRGGGRARRRRPLGPAAPPRRPSGRYDHAGAVRALERALAPPRG